MSTDYTVLLFKATEKKFDAFLDKPYLKDVKITPIIKHFKVFSEVNEVAEKHEADLIVMGSNGSDGFNEIFIGSNTERVVRTASVPVLVIKAEAESFSVDRFVFACDFTKESVPAVNKAQAFAELMGATLKLVYVNTPSDAFLSTGDIHKKVAKFLNALESDIEVDIYNEYTIERGVLSYAEAEGADLIGIATHGRRGIAHFFMGSIGEDIANHSKIPVVSFKIS